MSSCSGRNEMSLKFFIECLTIDVDRPTKYYVSQSTRSNPEFTFATVTGALVKSLPPY